MSELRNRFSGNASRRAAQLVAARNRGGVDFEIFPQNGGKIYRWMLGTPEANVRRPAAHDFLVVPLLASMKPCPLASAQPGCEEQSLT